MTDGYVNSTHNAEPNGIPAKMFNNGHEQGNKNIEDGIEYDPERDKGGLEQEEVVEDGELEDGYTEEDEMAVNDEDSDEFFEGLDDEGEKDIFDSDLANDNMDNDDDIIE